MVGKGAKGRFWKRFVFLSGLSTVDLKTKKNRTRGPKTRSGRTKQAGNGENDEGSAGFTWEAMRGHFDLFIVRYSSQTLGLNTNLYF